MKRLLSSLLLLVAVSAMCLACRKSPDPSGETPGPVTEDPATRNVSRAITLTEAALQNYFTGTSMEMSRYYNPYTKEKSSEKGSIWMYTSAIEATVAIMEVLVLQKEKGDTELYDKHFAHFRTVLGRLFEGMEFYKGTYTLTSFTQPASWSPYAVDRASSPGSANVTGVFNVYDDQMWLVRELIGAWRVTGEARYLSEAEYLASYVIDGWDCTVKNGKERGGIPWGPGYYSKHACSNGPMISPLVWLSEIYSGKADETTNRWIDLEDGHTRKSAPMKKSEYYLLYAQKIYDWSKANLQYTSGAEEGLYIDNLNSPSIGGTIQYETVDGQTYRRPADLRSKNGPAISYNAGTMLSGAADLYRVSKDPSLVDDMKALSDKSFSYFAKKGTVKEGLYTYAITGFNNWFNGVLLRGFVDVNPYYSGSSEAVQSFQDNLDFAWNNFIYNDMLPPSLLGGWNMDRTRNKVEGMFTLSFAAQYALLAKRLI